MCFYLQVLRLSISLFIFIILTVFPVCRPWSGLNETDAALLDETIRVAIVKSSQEVTIDGNGLLATSDTGAPVLLEFPATVGVARDGLQVGGQVYKRLIFSATSVIYINGKPYRGLAELSRLDKGILVVNQLALEDYLVGLINCEISSAWPIEAVKAQAVIARTYALNRKASRADAPYHLESSVIDQVYDGCLIEDSRARRAVTETDGEVLAYSGNVITAYYHSSCGGKTEASENVWGGALPYLNGVDCKYCLTSSASIVWENKLSLMTLEERLRAAGYKIAGLSDIKAGPLNSRGRLKQVTLVASRGGLSLTGEQFRKVIGYAVIKSTRFSVSVSKGEASFSGSGNGHGVGLCQWGAKQRALDGFNYKEILSYYYPGTELKKFAELK